MSGLRHLQIATGLTDPFTTGSFPRLQYVLKGIKREKGSAVKPRLPVTPQILMGLHRVWQREAGNPDNTMLWAACTLAFFGCLRSGELTVPSRAAFDPSIHLTAMDIAVDSHNDPSILQLRLKQSKTDPFRTGVMVYVGKTNSTLCPVSAVLAYMAARPADPGPLFRFADGSPLTRQALVRKLRGALRQLDINPDLFSGHSFRIGAATAAHRAGIDEATIRMLGRWESDAVLRYIRTPRAQLAALSQQLARHTTS